MTHLVLTVINKRSSTGEPPALVNRSDAMTSYFENTQGGQWVFTCNSSGEFRIQGGDIGWDDDVTGNVKEADLRGDHQPVFSEVELSWLDACMMSAGQRFGLF